MSAKRVWCVEALPARRVLAATVMENEPNNTEITADPIFFPQDGQASLVGTAENKDDKDYFTISPTEGGKLTLEVSSSADKTPALEITTRTGEQLFETQPNDDVNSGSVMLQAGIQYFVRMRGKQNDPSDYQVALTFTGKTGSAPGPGGGITPGTSVDEVEPNGTQGTALRFEFGADRTIRLQGESTSQDDRDFFKFTAPNSGQLTVEVEATNKAFAKIEIEDGQGNVVFESEPNDGINGGTAQLVAGTTYYVRARAIDTSAVAYQVDLAFREVGDSDNSGAFDTSDLVAIMQAGKYDTGERCSFGEGDWNGDGVFDQADLILAFQTGNFHQ